MSYDIAKDPEAAVIVKGIIRMLKGEIVDRSHLVRSNEYRMLDLIEGFPPEFHSKAQEIVLQMTVDYLLLQEYKNGKVFFKLNPNKIEDIRKLLAAIRTPKQQIEGNPPIGYSICFEKDGARTSKGALVRYVYYIDPNDDTHFFVLIQRNIHAKAEKTIDLGSMFVSSSIIHQVWDTIDTKLQKPIFRKADLHRLIPDYSIVENRQPLKAAFDVLEYLGYVRKAGRRRGNSQEYERTGRVPIKGA